MNDSNIEILSDAVFQRLCAIFDECTPRELVKLLGVFNSIAQERSGGYLELPGLPLLRITQDDAVQFERAVRDGIGLRNVA